MNFCLIGYPLGHSMSPFIHKNLFSLSGKNADYVNIEIPPEQLTEKVKQLDVFGFNVTIPHKTAVIPLLDRLEGKAKVLKTVNTVKIENGKMIGYNTDCDGFLKSLELAGIELCGNVIICGAGGTARMMCYLAAEKGCNITLCVRPSGVERANNLKNEVCSVYPANIKINDFDSSYDLLLNATPAGMYPNNIGLLPCDKAIVDSAKAVFDAVYNPRSTKLIETALANGSKVAYGMPMLVYQAAKAHEIWYGATFNNDDLFQIIDKTNSELERMN
ncbi:MAG: shikimate dehydrogenase [Clostridia bacterium]|nr:shikimate dehydrogenase [Clostridia bacterium]